jgi:hypothetical protein
MSDFYVTKHAVFVRGNFGAEVSIFQENLHFMQGSEWDLFNSRPSLRNNHLTTCKTLKTLMMLENNCFLKISPFRLFSCFLFSSSSFFTDFIRVVFCKPIGTFPRQSHLYVRCPCEISQMIFYIVNYYWAENRLHWRDVGPRVKKKI